MALFQKQLVFQSSLIAAATGHNPYRRATEILENMWYSHSQTTFRKAFDQAAIKSIKDVKWQSINAIPGAKQLIMDSQKQAAGLNSIDKLQKQVSLSGHEIQKHVDSLKCDITDLENKIKQDSLEQISPITSDQHQLDLLNKKAVEITTASQVVKQEIEKTLNMTFGTDKEADAVSQYEKQTGISVNREKKLSKVFYHDFWVSGIVDGLIGDDCVLEVKNRSKRLFNKIPYYEMIQIQAYMHNLQKSKAILLECLRKDNHFDFNSIEVEIDDKIWSDILRRLENFSNYLKLLITDESEATKYGLMSAQQRDIHFLKILDC